MESVEKLSGFFKKLPTDLSRARKAVQNAYNPNHRHDEAWEIANDEARAKICESHRFQSFAGEREGNDVKFYVDGHDYFYALSSELSVLCGPERIWS